MDDRRQRRTSNGDDVDHLSEDDDRMHSRKRQNDSHDNDSASTSNDSSDGRDRKRSRSSSSKKRKHKHKKHSNSSRRKHRDDSSSESQSKERRQQQQQEEASCSESSGDSTSTEEEDRKRRKKHSKSKRKHKDHKKERKHKKEKKRKVENDKERKDKEDDDVPVFGKFGILKASDFYKKQRSFEKWMEEIKGMPHFNGAKWEQQKYFDEYREDYNTATLPHIKYYDFEKWEMEDYQKQQAKQRELADSGKSSRQADEARHQLEQRKMAHHKQRADQNLILSMMSREKVQEMKRQQQLKAELEVAFKTGDQEKIKKLKAKLEPEPK